MITERKKIRALLVSRAFVAETGLKLSFSRLWFLVSPTINNDQAQHTDACLIEWSAERYRPRPQSEYAERNLSFAAMESIRLSLLLLLLWWGVFASPPPITKIVYRKLEYVKEQAEPCLDRNKPQCRFPYLGLGRSPALRNVSHITVPIIVKRGVKTCSECDLCKVLYSSTL